ncbi:DUF445 domain-containing protein [Lederbergia citri]|uniref:DUF445 domain-containing protein n=1 Tax=Lederbergia citri TaxID=2833580 RepID=A0A942T9A1_9BACI|nr:DUF445 family protein [Lederbergia citri]MBS4193538.1 DUF445 domain-containing protein [Lederbergia citri]
MPNWLSLILFMIFVGAAIGGFTNFIAIRMLFRPYKTFYIGKWQLPFTPGLIPKRQNELAAQIGKLIVNHLVTPESIQKKLSEEKFKHDMETWFSGKIRSFLEKGMTLEELLKIIHIENPSKTIISYMDAKIENKYAGMKDEFWQKEFQDILPIELNENIRGKIPGASDSILQKTIEYFSSQEGKDKIKAMIEDFFKDRGRLWNMIQMFIGNDSLTEKVQPEIIKFLNSPGTKSMLTNVIESEWDKMQNKPVGEILKQLEDEKVLLYIKRFVKDTIQLEKFFKKDIAEILLPFREKLEESFVPRMLDSAGIYIAQRSGEIMERFQVEAIIREQIESFSLPHLEELVISIAKKELVMITYLGAILGGLIGLIQGIIVLLTS